MEKFGAAKQAGDLPAAARHLEAALAEAEKLGPHNPRTAITLLNLGAVFSEQGSFDKAEPLLRRANAALEATLGPDDPNLALSFAAQAFNLGRLGKHAEAEGLYRRSLAILEKTPEPEGPDTVSALMGLADASENQGKLAEADAVQRRLLEMVEKHAGKEGPALEAILERRASLLRKLGRNPEADQAAARAAAIGAAAVEMEKRDAAGPRYMGKTVQQWIRELGDGSMEAWRQLSAPEKEAAPVLGELLGSEVARVRAVAASGLAHIGGDAVVPLVGPLGRALGDKNLNVRYFAARALKGMGPAAAPAVPSLIAALDTHPSREPGLEGPPRYYKDARSVAAEALAAVGPAAKPALPKLRELAAKDDEADVRAAAADAVKTIEAK